MGGYREVVGRGASPLLSRLSVREVTVCRVTRVRARGGSFGDFVLSTDQSEVGTLQGLLRVLTGGGGTGTGLGIVEPGGGLGSGHVEGGGVVG